MPQNPTETSLATSSRFNVARGPFYRPSYEIISAILCFVLISLLAGAFTSCNNSKTVMQGSFTSVIEIVSKYSDRILHFKKDYI